VADYLKVLAQADPNIDDLIQREHPLPKFGWHRGAWGDSQSDSFSAENLQYGGVGLSSKRAEVTITD